MTNEEWLQILGKATKCDSDFEKLGHPICDGIRMPDLPLLFGNGENRFTLMKNFFVDMKISVLHLGEA